MTRTKFAQHRADLVAEAIGALQPFRTSGNLSGKPVSGSGDVYPSGRERRHPAWEHVLRSMSDALVRRDNSFPFQARPVYVVGSFGTIIGVLMRREIGETTDYYWLLDYSAARHSGYTSRAVSVFRRAIGKDLPYYSDRGIRSLSYMLGGDISYVEIGEQWQIAQDLSETQRYYMSAGRGLTIPKPTRAVLVRRGLLDDSTGFLTPLGLGVSDYC